jgi:flagellar motor protein MotB
MAITLLALLCNQSLMAEGLLDFNDNPEGEFEFPTATLSSYPIGENTEQHMLPDEIFNLYIQDETFFRPQEDDTVEIKKVLERHAKTFKLDNVVKPIRFKAGEANIPQSFVKKLRDVLAGMKNRANVRLHFIGHTDADKLSGATKAKYGDNIGLSKIRAEIAAEFFQRELDLPADAVSYDGAGESKPIASNLTAEGKAKNRRVEVQIWYDEITETAVNEEVVVSAERLNRIKVCRKETVCKLSYKKGNAKRARLRNLITPLRMEDGQSEIPKEFIRQIQEVADNLKDKQNVVIRFVGHTDNLPLEDRQARIYGNHEALSKARARRTSLAVQEILNLPYQSIGSTGKGSAYPVASNDNMKGRGLNRRIEVEFWHDDPFQEFTADPQACPESAAAEIITLSYDPPTGPIKSLRFNDGKPVIQPRLISRLHRLMGEISDKSNVRLGLTGFTSNKRMDRRTAMVYGDDIGLSTSRARRTMEVIKEEMGLNKKQIEYQGRGFVHSDDVVSTGFIQLDTSRVEIEVLYDELAILEEDEGLDITHITQEAKAINPFGLNLMRITVDGKPLYDPYRNIADLQRCTDVSLENADIQFRFDNLKIKPKLNISIWPTSIRFQDDEKTELSENKVQFKTYSNYWDFIERSEIRIFNESQAVTDEPLEIVAVDVDGKASWQANFETYQAPLKSLKYVLRVYNGKGSFDETKSQTIWIVDEINQTDELINIKEELLVGYGGNRLSIQNIPINGGTVSVNGDQIPEDHTVWFAGRPVPVNGKGKFVSEEIFSKDRYNIEVAVLDTEGNGDLYLRELAFKKNDWFYVGLADLTFSRDNTNGPAELVTNDETHYDNDLSFDGHLAFFVNGNFSDDWQLTASADTLEGPLKDIFSNFLDKSPDALFRRIDPDYVYPTFGDDSVVEEMAPTLGKFYLKLKKHENYGLWGNFDISYLENDLAHIDRGLYGARGHYESEDATSFGEKRFLIDGFAAEPGTISGREEFRGTGGSLYFLKHQDILTGSDRLRIEIRDKDSGRVIGVKNLTTAIDYDIDYIQGRVLLGEPLSSISNDNLLVDSGSFSGHPVYLVARYEYSPNITELDDVTVGGRIHYWFGDSLKLGITSNKQQELGSESELNGFDLTFRKNAGSWFKIEAANSQGIANTSLSSADGGFSFDSLNTDFDDDIEANAFRFEVNTRLSDIYDGLRGSTSFYVQKREKGFSAPGQLTSSETVQSGGSLRTAFTNDIDFNVKFDNRYQANSLETETVDADVGYQLDDNWKLSTGARFDRRTDNSITIPGTQKQGDRFDLAVEANYDSKEDWIAYGFMQGTTNSTGNREDNNRAGGGGSYRATERLKLDGELSAGDTGTGIKAGTDYLMSDRTNLYLNYALENERTDNGVRSRQGNMAGGFKSRYSDSVSIYGEERYAHGDVPTGLTHAMGVDIAPNDKWNYGASIEKGTLEDKLTAAQTERSAIGLTLGYALDSIKYAGAVEYRNDKSEAIDTTISERETWLLKNTFKYSLNLDWRFVGKLNWSDSKSSQGEFYDGAFREAVIGYGFRPVKNDVWNTLFKYTYFFNLPSTDQVTANNTAVEFIQKSHIISVDTLYDLSKRWSLGGKYAYRLGQVSLDRVNQEFFDSRASLYVLRADWHFVHRWDALMEMRLLDLPDAQDQRSGALLGIYRHVGKNFKFGIGYNFTDFSDDLTDLDFDSQGLFINLIAKI